MKKKWKQISLCSLGYVVVSTGAVIMMIPLIWMVSTSLKPASDVFTMPPKWIPNPIDWANYARAFGMIDYILFFRNSFIVAFICISGFLFSTSLAAYAFARLRFFGRDVFFVLVLSALMLPFATMIMPQYLLFARLGWVDTFLPLTVPAFFACGYGGAFLIFLLRQFFLTPQIPPASHVA